MALIKGNVAVFGARGRLSDLLYYRFRHGSQELCAMPQKSDKPRSPGQLAQQELMIEANRYYRKIKKDPEKMAWYKKMAERKGKTDTYHAVLSHFMTSPRLRQEDTSGYEGKTGDIIRCQPRAWDKVASVTVRIKDRLGQEVESGPAVKEKYDWWSYTASQTAAEWEGFTVVFEISDDLDHTGVREVPLSP